MNNKKVKENKCCEKCEYPRDILSPDVIGYLLFCTNKSCPCHLPEPIEDKLYACGIKLTGSKLAIEEKCICKTPFDSCKNCIFTPSSNSKVEESWEKSFNEEFGICNGGDALYAKIDDDGLSVKQYLKSFIKKVESQARQEERENILWQLRNVVLGDDDGMDTLEEIINEAGLSDNEISK